MTNTTCACCSGVAVRTPQTMGNRPGLPTLAYRAGHHSDFLHSMIARLAHESRPALGELTTRDDDDFTIALLDGWAVVADVLTFYNERLVNESYVRTARERASLQELGKLIGYQLDPGAAAETYLAFSIEHPPSVPAQQPKDPGSAPPVTPTVVDLDSGIRVQSIPGPGEKPQMFETVESVEARPEWNAMAVTTTSPWDALAPNVTEAWLEGVGLNLVPGDVFLLAGTNIKGERWDVRILEDISPDPDNDRTKVSWTEALGSKTPAKKPAANPEAYVLRKRVNVFGYNAPSWNAMSQDFRDDYTGETDTKKSEWPDFSIGPKKTVVDLDGSHSDIVAPSWIVLNKPTYRELWRVDEVSELARAEFAVSGKVTRLTLVDGENYNLFDDEVRETTVFAVSESLTLVDQPDVRVVGSDSVTVDVDVSTMLPGRSVVVAGKTQAGKPKTERAVVKSVSVSNKTWTLTFEDDLTYTYDRSTVIVYGNVALATHGESVSEILGSGRAWDSYQRFSLARTPLTFVQSTDPSGTETTLQVRVNGVAWDESSTLYDAEPSDREFNVRMDEEGNRTVRFGNGVKGARLPTGSQNIVAEYRHGLGVAGNVAAESLAQLLDRPLGAKGVSNPSAADGGVDPENEEAARSTMPLKVRTLGRAVSLLDYADFARAVTGVSKAHATVLTLAGIRTIVVTVAFTPGTVTNPTNRASDIESSLRTFGDPQVEVKVLAHHEDSFRLGLRISVEDAYDDDVVTKAVKDTIISSFAFERRDLNEPLHTSEIVAIAHGIPGVAAVDVDHLYTGSTAGLTSRLLPQTPSVTSSGTAAPAGLLVIDTDPFDALEVMP